MYIYNIYTKNIYKSQPFKKLYLKNPPQFIDLLVHINSKLAKSRVFMAWGINLSIFYTLSFFALFHVKIGDRAENGGSASEHAIWQHISYHIQTNGIPNTLFIDFGTECVWLICVSFRNAHK